MVATASRRCIQCDAQLPRPPHPQPRLHVCRDCGWEAAPGPQTQFLASTAFEVLYGGAAGGGKSEALLMDALRHIDKPTYRGLLLRRTMPELRRSLIDRALKWYSKVAPGGFIASPTPLWRFPSGAIIEFSHLQHESDVTNFDSAEFQFIGFDELSHFTERQYTYLLSRLRSSDGIPVRVRAGTNPPEDLTGAWVLKRFAPWLDRSADYHGVRVESGRPLYFIGSREAGERYVERGTIDEEGNAARARLFIQAKVADNPYVDPEYKSTLLALDAISRARKLDGDWSQLDKPGALWKRADINAKRVQAAPPLRRIGIALDPSGSHRKGSDEAGIVAGGLGPCHCRGLVNQDDQPIAEEHAFVFADKSGILSATMQARTAIDLYHSRQADFIVGEVNYGGEWIGATISEIDATVNFKCIHVSKGKAVRAEPVAALYDSSRPNGGIVHHVGELVGLENQLCTFDPRRPPTVSPGRMDALVFLLSELLLGSATAGFGDDDDGYGRRV